MNYSCISWINIFYYNLVKTIIRIKVRTPTKKRENSTIPTMQQTFLLLGATYTGEGLTITTFELVGGGIV